MSIEQIVKYFQFIFAFLGNPHTALAKFSGSGDIEIALGDFLLNGLVLITGVTLAIEKATRFDINRAFEEMPDGLAFIYIWFRWMVRFPLLGPLAFFLLVSGGTQYFHWSILGSRLVLGYLGVNLTYLEGSWQDTFNGLMGFYSVFYPVIAALAAVSFAVLQNSSVWGIRLLKALIGLAYGTFVVYFPLAISAVHPDTSYWEVWLALLLSVPIGLAILLAIYLVGRALRMVRR
ncbi:MAG: hypothetical protein J4N94_04220 [Chloroflexi bacterium]|nr:hypothetical protein [Chloroflexota bacterium]